MKSSPRLHLLGILILLALPQTNAQINREIDSATVLIEAKKYENAIEYIEDALNRHGDAAPLLRVLGQAYRRMNRAVDAAESFDRAWAAELCDSCYADLEMAGMISLGANDADRAKAYFLRAAGYGSTGVRPQLAKLFFREGEQKLVEQDYSAAARSYRAGLAYNEDTVLFQRLLYSYFLDQKFDSLTQLADKLSASHPDFLAPRVFSATLRFNEGNALIAEEKYMEAIGKFERSLEQSPGNANALFGIGYCHDKLKDTARALSFYEQALALGSREPMVYFNSGRLYLARGDASSAVDVLKKCVRLKWQYPAAWSALSEAFALAGDRESATSAYRQAARLGCEECIKKLRAQGEAVVRTTFRSDLHLDEFPWLLKPVGLTFGDTLEALDARTGIASTEENGSDSIRLGEQPIPIGRVVPEYPEIARRAGIEGTVWLKLLITPEGKVSKVVVLVAEAEILIEPSIIAARKLEFKPRTAEMNPTSQWAILPFRFKLNK